MRKHLRRIRGALIALVILAFSAGLAFGASPPDGASWGLSNAASHAGKTVPVAGGDEETGDEETGEETGDEETGDEETGEESEAAEEESEEAGENCATDPSTLTPEDLALMRHGSIVCWAAHQTEWPEWFANHGAFVRCWAHQGKADAPSCTEAPAEDAVLAESGHGHGKGKAKGHANQP